MDITKEKVLEALSYVEDPDLKKDLVTLNMIRDIQIDGKNVSFTVMLTTPACPLKALIEKACLNAIIHYVDADAVVNIKMSSEVTSKKGEQKKALPFVKNIIAVASGKGEINRCCKLSHCASAKRSESRSCRCRYLWSFSPCNAWFG